MVKPDVKRNYYADLELPPTATVDDVRKAYRKLALQYHPDRNSGREEECIPKFQAIQAANEVLCDAALKQKYDNDRRRAGLVPGGAPRQPTMGNPYQATSNFPPPPRRTQPGTWQRPQTAAGAAPPNGADRFSQFPRPSPTARKDPAQDRTNMFKAWQNMNNAQERQRNFTAPGQPPQPPPQQQPQAAARPRPPPPPRNASNLPTEERIRAGMNHRRAPSNNIFEAANADPRQSAWSSFGQPAGTQPGAAQMKTPRKAGFNPNTPGSDERAAPMTGSHYANRRRSEDIGRSGKGDTPARGSAGTSPPSPAERPPARTRTFDESQSFAETNRERTPYAAFIGERMVSPAEQLRRSHSTRDTTRLNPNVDRGRARSTSPLGRQSAPGGEKPKPFVQYSSSEASDVDTGSDDAQPAARPGTAPGGSATTDRPKKTPAPPSRRFDGTPNLASSAKVPMSAGTAETAQPDNNGQSNMYDNPSSSPTPAPFRTRDWLRAMFGSYSTSRATSRHDQIVPKWAIPSSISPSLTKVSTERRQESFVTAADELYITATPEVKAAFHHLQAELRRKYGHVPHNLDMDAFNRLVATIDSFGTCGDGTLDELVKRVLVEFSIVDVRNTSANNSTDENLRGSSFSFQRDPRWFAQPTKSRSDDNINTNFSKEPWSGNFTGEPDYFGSADGAAKKPPSPTRRPGSAKSTQRSSTMDVPADPNAPKERVSPRPWGSDGLPRISVAEPDSAFSQAQWQKTFQDPSWTWPKNPSPLGPGASTPVGSTRSQQTTRSATGDSLRPGTVNDGAAQGSSAYVEDADDGDAMDVDTPAPTSTDSGASEGKPARVYAVPPSAWRQQQAQQQQTSEPGKSQGGKIYTSLDDLLNVEPLAPSTEGAGLKNLGDLSATLPFTSQPSSTVRPMTPRDLKLPDIPKAPEAPSRLTRTSWPAYASLFGAYLKAFHALNATMLQHFAARERLAQDRFAAGMDFLEATGDGTGMRLDGRPGGYGSYFQAVEEDRRVRETWTLACDRHADAVRLFAGVRDQVKRLTVGGGLAEA